MRTSLLRLRRLLSGASGQEIAEAAVVLPLLFMLLLGIYAFGRVFNIYGTINHAARQGARVGIQPCASCAQLSTAALNAQVATAVTQALNASKLDPNQAQIYSPAPVPAGCPGASAPLCSTATLSASGQIQVCNPVQLNAGSPDPPVCGITVSFQYPYQFWFPFTSLNMQNILVKASVQADGEE